MFSRVAVTWRAVGVAAGASTSTRSRPPALRRFARSRSPLPRAASGDHTETYDDGTTSASDLVELECGGVSVSPRGFVALLVRKGVKESIPRAANEVEAMRGADPAADLAPEVAREFVIPVLITELDEDAEGAQSARAQTMLQLLQEPPCDMGIQLPYGALEQVTNVAGDAVLGAVLVGKAAFDERENEDEDAPFVWEATLLAGVGAEQSAVDVIGGADDAWQCLALARRYARYGCRVFATKEAVAGASTATTAFSFSRDGDGDAPAALTVASVRRAFPNMQTVTESRAIAAEAREKFLWAPFAAATADDVPTVDGDGDAIPDARDETP